MTIRPVYCGHGPNGRACNALAEHFVAGPDYRAVCCRRHLDAEKRTAGIGRVTVTVTPVTQPADAVSGDGQAALFALEPQR
jgi:hypothetical protein